MHLYRSQRLLCVSSRMMVFLGKTRPNGLPPSVAGRPVCWVDEEQGELLVPAASVSRSILIQLGLGMADGLLARRLAADRLHSQILRAELRRKDQHFDAAVLRAALFRGV